MSRNFFVHSLKWYMNKRLETNQFLDKNYFIYVDFVKINHMNTKDSNNLDSSAD